MKAVVLRVGGDLYALPVERVRRLIPFQRPRPLPSTEPSSLGLVSVRGELVAVWDLATRLGLVPHGTDVIALVEGVAGIGFAVDGVIGVRDLPPLSPLPQG